MSFEMFAPTESVSEILKYFFLPKKSGSRSLSKSQWHYSFAKMQICQSFSASYCKFSYSFRDINIKRIVTFRKYLNVTEYNFEITSFDGKSQNLEYFHTFFR